MVGGLVVWIMSKTKMQDKAGWSDLVANEAPAPPPPCLSQSTELQVLESETELPVRPFLQFAIEKNKGQLCDAASFQFLRVLPRLVLRSSIAPMQPPQTMEGQTIAQNS